jgi:hypothetical protein
VRLSAEWEKIAMIWLVGKWAGFIRETSLTID